MLTNEEYLLEKANNGDIDAMFELGMFELLINKNYDHSSNWLEKAYENGKLEASIGMTLYCSKTDHSDICYWANKALETLGIDYFKELDDLYFGVQEARLIKKTKWNHGGSYSVHKTIKLLKGQIEIGAGYSEKPNIRYASVTLSLDDIEKNKYILNEELENDIRNLSLDEPFDETISMLENLYKETKYPGYLYMIGIMFWCGDCDFKQRDEEKAIEYFEKSAEKGYYNAKVRLSDIYLHKANESIIKAMKHYDNNETYDKLMHGICLIANNLFESKGYYLEDYDRYFQGLEKITEASQEGDGEASLILNLLGKDKLTKRMYKQGLNKEKETFKNYIDSIKNCSFDHENYAIENEELDNLLLDEE